MPRETNLQKAEKRLAEETQRLEEYKKTEAYQAALTYRLDYRVARENEEMARMAVETAKEQAFVKLGIFVVQDKRANWNPKFLEAVAKAFGTDGREDLPGIPPYLNPLGNLARKIEDELLTRDPESMKVLNAIQALLIDAVARTTKFRMLHPKPDGQLNDIEQSIQYAHHEVAEETRKRTVYMGRQEEKKELSAGLRAETERKKRVAERILKYLDPTTKGLPEGFDWKVTE